ncbi:glycosyltransferase family 4 protein [Sphingomonas bacterium]|uniref:glycosyltransferase family 4 protein n=1 Tax=Sphingomonas bacterium TaxID=1895847 RepID=UPI0015765C0C|nr:glycosyltransferase family 4 protein [Sphingomonas bacterium]
MKIAIIQDWLTLKGGAEAVLEQVMELFPQADLFCIVDFLPEHERGFLKGRRITTSFIQRLPRARKSYRSYLPLMPIAIEQLDVTGYDLVLSFSASVAKGVITGPEQLHICYTHSPIRYAWDLQHQYLAEANMTRSIKGMVARAILHYMRLWDIQSAHSTDHFIANSVFIARRIRRLYGREAAVIYPPVDVDRFAQSDDRDDVYVTVSRLVPYKRIPLIVEAFRRMPERRLVVIGDGPEMPAVRAAAGPNVTIMGKQPDDVVVAHLQRARAFLFAAEEDFGIAPVEAQACGTPVIAYGRGGALETVRGEAGPGRSGLFFAEQSVDSIVDAVTRFEAIRETITPAACRASAQRFATDRFREAFARFVAEALAAHGATRIEERQRYLA